MAEKEQTHRHKLQTKALAYSMWNTRIGQFMAFLLSLVVIASGVYLALQGHETVAGIIFGTSLVGLAALFITRQFREPGKEDSP